MVDVGFHYTKEKNWLRLNSSGNKNQTLDPRRRLISSFDAPDDLPDWAHDGYIFAFPGSLAPGPWKNCKYGSKEWDKLTGGIGRKIVGVKFDVVSSDDAYVVDRAHYADWQWGRSSDKADAIRKYALSRISAKEYGGNFRMPELIIRNSIPIERLIVSEVFSRDLVLKGNKCDISYRPLNLP